MILHLPERYRDIAAVGARITKNDWDEGYLATPMPIIHIQAAHNKLLDLTNSVEIYGICYNDVTDSH